MTNGQRTVTILLAIVAVTSTANAAIIFVDDDNCPGPGSGTVGDPYCSIQDAIDAAVDTDEIVVAPGTYFENISFLGKAITLRSSDGPQVTIIEGDSLDTVVRFDDVEVRETVMDGFKITNGIGHLVDLQRFGGGVFIDGISSPTIKNCVVAGNTSARGGASLAATLPLH